MSLKGVSTVDHSALCQHVHTVCGAVKDNYGGFDIKAYDGLMAWLVKHTSCIYTRYLLHAHGQIAYERRRGRTCKPLHVRVRGDESIARCAMTFRGPTPAGTLGYGLACVCRATSTASALPRALRIRTKDVKRLPKGERDQAEYFKHGASVIGMLARRAKLIMDLPQTVIASRTTTTGSFARR